MQDINKQLVLDVSLLESHFLAKPLKATKVTKHTISSGNKTYHKKEVADITKIVRGNKNLLQEEKKATSGKKALEERERETRSEIYYE